MTLKEALALSRKKAVLEYTRLCGRDSKSYRYFEVSKAFVGEGHSPPHRSGMGTPCCKQKFPTYDFIQNDPTLALP